MQYIRPIDSSVVYGVDGLLFSLDLAVFVAVVQFLWSLGTMLFCLASNSLHYHELNRAAYTGVMTG